MRSRDVVGRKIVAIHQYRRAAGIARCPFVDVQAIELEGGVFMIPNTVETDWDYGHNMRVLRPTDPESFVEHLKRGGDLTGYSWLLSTQN